MIVVFDRDPELYTKSLQDEENFFRKNSEDEKNFINLILSELRDELVRLKIDLGYQVSLIGEPDASGWDGGLCMHQEDGYWLVYHSERGNRHKPNIFTNVQSAANYFLWYHIAKPDGKNSDVGMLPRLFN